MREGDEHKDEIKKQSASAEEEKGPKQGQGEGEQRYYILMLKLKQRSLCVPSAVKLSNPCLSLPFLDKTFQDQATCKTRQWCTNLK